MGTSERIDANEALRIGLCDEIVDDKNLLISRAEELIRPYLDQRFPGSVQGAKRVVSADPLDENDVERKRRIAHPETAHLRRARGKQHALVFAHLCAKHQTARLRLIGISQLDAECVRRVVCRHFKIDDLQT